MALRLCLYVLVLLVMPTMLMAFEQNGMTYTNGKYCPNVTFASQRSLESLTHLRSTGANWVSIVVSWYQAGTQGTEIFPLYTSSLYSEDGYYEYKTPPDEVLNKAVKDALRLGFKVMLKPHIDPVGVPRSVWRGDIGGGFTDDQWDLWFKSYTSFILHYAELSEKWGIHELSLSCELITASYQEAGWRKVIAEVRKVYSGILTDSANWGGQEQRQTYWDALDVIGVDAYYPILPDVHSPTLEQLVEAWQPTISILKALHEKWNKDIAFTEVGFCARECNRYGKPSADDLQYMATHYESLFVAFKDLEWFKGVFWWNWNTDSQFGGESNYCMDPKFKPTEEVLRKYYGATEPMPKQTGDPLCLCTL